MDGSWLHASVGETPEKAPAAVRRPIRSEAGGYFAMLAFLAAYCLNVAGTARLAQAALNLCGAAVAAIYLHKKGAVPSVISNLAWGLITLAGLVVR